MDSDFENKRKTVSVLLVAALISASALFAALYIFNENIPTPGKTPLCAGIGILDGNEPEFNTAEQAIAAYNKTAKPTPPYVLIRANEATRQPDGKYMVSGGCVDMHSGAR